MAATATLAQMIASVRRRANIQSQTGFIDDTELTEELNYALSELYDLLVGVGGQPFYRSSVTANTVANQANYTLPADFYKMQSLDVDFGGGIVRSCKPFMEEERNIFRYPLTGWIYQLPIYYRMQGATTLTFIPSPTGVFPYTINYYPTFAKLVNAGDTFDGVNGWEEYAVWVVTAYCKAKGDEDPGFAMGRAAQLKDRIQAMAGTRDVNHNEIVADPDTEVFTSWPHG